MSVSCSSPTGSSKKCSGASSDVLISKNHAEYTPQLLIGPNAPIKSDKFASQLIIVTLNRATTKISIKMYNSDGTWELLSEKPKKVFNGSAITHSENKIFVLDCEYNLEYFDLIEKEWIHLSSTFRYNDEQSLVYYKGQVYGIGPCSCKAMNISTKTMTSVSPMKYPRFGAGIEVIDDKIYVIGGQLNEHGISCNKVENYEPEKDIWTECSSLNVPTTYNTVVFFNGYLYSFNGYFTEVERYKPGDDHWESIASLPLANVASACVYKDSIIVLCITYRADVNKWFKYNEPENKWNEIDISYPDDDYIMYLCCVDRDIIKC